MLLIYPPVAKPGEPPAGIARLGGALKGAGYNHTLLDANIEGLYYLLAQERKPVDTWSRRAESNLENNLRALKEKKIYSNHDRYNRTVREINRTLEQTAVEKNLSLSLVNYTDTSCSPLRSEELVQAGEDYEKNIYFPYFSRRIEQLLAENDYTAVGLSLSYLSQAPTCFAIIGFIKKNFPEMTLLLGGGLVTSWLSQPNWNNPFEDLVDQLIGGCGEEQLLQFLELETKHYNLPDYSTFPLDKYLSPGFTLPYSASSGCYWHKCSFCPEVAENNPYITRQPGSTAQELDQLQDHYRPTLIHFLDNALNPTFLKQLINKPPGAPWYGFARVSKELQDQDFCHQLRKAGCVMLKLGLESGNQQILDKMNKGVSLQAISTTLHCLQQAGIATYVYLLFGTPYESSKEAADTLNFVVDHSDAVTFLNLAIFNMPLYSRDAAVFETQSFFAADLSLYCNFKHPLGWGRKQVRTFLNKEFKAHPKIAPIIQRDPPFFTSNHAPFFTYL